MQAGGGARRRSPSPGAAHDAGAVARNRRRKRSRSACRPTASRITADFAGADLTIFGAIENADPLLSRQGRYDVIVVLEGPARPVVVRRKDRVLGMWINIDVGNLRQRAGVLFDGHHAPAAGHHRPEQLPATVARRRQPAHRSRWTRSAAPATHRGIHRGAARAEDGDRALQRAHRRRAVPVARACSAPRCTLAPNVPVGTHKARAFLFRNGVFIKETSAQLAIVQVRLRADASTASPATTACLYGLFAVAARHADRLAGPHHLPQGLRTSPIQPGRQHRAGNGEDAARRRSCRPSGRRCGTGRHRRGRAR